MIGPQRLATQGLATRPFADPAAAVRALGAMQAQDYGQALWAIAARTAAGTCADVEQAIADRQIVRTWPMRSTIHFVPAEDCRWMVQYAAPRRLAALRTRYAQLDLADAVVARCMALFADALRGGQALTREALMALLADDGFATGNQRGYHMLVHAAQIGLTCFGPIAGKQQTFVLLDGWVPASRELVGDDALRELARRYMAGHAPATARDFAWWAGLTLGDARRALPEAGDPPPVAAAPHVLLLPAFDEFMLGYQDRSAVLDPAHADRIVPGGNGVFRPILVVDGRIVGTWRKRVVKRAFHVDVEPFGPMDGLEPALQAAAARVAAAHGHGEVHMTATCG